MKREILSEPFKAHASLMSHLGDQLIEDDITAISELVKNSYDADATLVEIYVDSNYSTNNERGKIEIIDDGSGMSVEDIVNGWLKISGSKKREMKKNKKVTTKFKRYPLGEKGLGRLSVMRLGNNLTLITKQENSSEEFILEINWKQFEQDRNLNDITFTIYSRTIIKKQEQSYTKLIVTNLNNIDVWKSKRKIDKLEKDLSKIISPFTYHSSFMIYAKIDDREFEFEKISNHVLKSARCKYQFNLQGNKIYIHSNYSLDYFYKEDFFNLIKKNGLEDFYNTYTKDIKEYNLRYLKDNECFEGYEEINLENIDALRINRVNRDIFHPGNFEGELYSYYYDSNYIKEQILNNRLSGIFNGGIRDFTELIKKNSGIKVFRDQFRILPYGRPGNDWLGISKGTTSTGSSYYLKNNNILGFINLTGLQNSQLREKTDRSGFIDDEYYKNFFLILNEVIKRINYTRDKLRRLLNKYENKVISKNGEEILTHKTAIKDLSKIGKEHQKIKEEVKIVKKEMIKVNKESSKTQNIEPKNKKLEDQSNKSDEVVIKKVPNMINLIENYLNNLDKIDSHTKVLENEYNILVEQLERITELAGLGLSAEAITHELYAIVDNIKKETKRIKNLIEPNNSEVLRYLDRVYSYSDGLRKQISHLSPGFRNVRNVKKDINLKQLLIENIEYHKDRAKRKGIKINLKVENDSFEIYANKGMISQVLDNLYYNSEHWLNHAKERGIIENSEYHLYLDSEGILTIWDNGLGIDPTLNKKIFEPFVTNKEDGRGLGLFIANQLLDSNGTYIQLKSEKNKFNNLYKFEIDLSKCTKE